MKHVEVFTTNVTGLEVSKLIIMCLSSHSEGSQVSFDLEDVDKVLRVASRQPIDVAAIVQTVSMFGFQANVMADLENLKLP